MLYVDQLPNCCHLIRQHELCQLATGRGANCDLGTLKVDGWRLFRQFMVGVCFGNLLYGCLLPVAKSFKMVIITKWVPCVRVCIASGMHPVSMRHLIVSFG